ncbi:MAG: glycosyltransferase family 2 protein [Myxococcota bacterium]|jgi:dolichol-phosphate mannosyltransferase|nr:glycosyltransferase family 2 protein [Myxococcota bacterium]
MPHLTVVAPLFNEAACVEALMRRVEAAVAPITADWTLHLVDDGSSDATWSMLVANTEPRIVGFRLAANVGQFTAIRAGLSTCDADWVVVMDGDLQEPPESIPALYDAAMAGHDLVLARKVRRNQPATQRMVTGIFYWALNRLATERYDPGVGNFRMLSRRNVAWVLAHGIDSWLYGLMGDPSLPRAFVDFQHDARLAGETSYRWGRRVHMGVTGLRAAVNPGPPVATSPSRFVITERTDD